METKNPVDALLPDPDASQPCPGPKWLAMSPKERRKWEAKQWTERDLDYDGPCLVTPPQPKSHTWLLFVIPIVMGIIVVTFDLTEKESALGFFALLLGLGLGAMYGERKVTRANEKDPIRTICRTVEGMSENAYWVFNRREEEAIEKLQRILKTFRKRLPR